jgi:hypothetical protein
MDANDVGDAREVNIPLKELRDLIQSHAALAEEVQKVSHLAAIAHDELEHAKGEAQRWESFAEELYDRHDDVKDYKQ